MRLTLRTLLAYLDDVLDPGDKDELAQKIESSEFAEDLVHRTRDTMRRLRLSAPQVIGTGMALDPNTVAEYLDNVLPPEQVGDFERICLESDVHLAEAAACHHVLTMVLGEPADVDPRARQRMYGIPAEARERKRVRVEGAHGQAAGASAAKPAAASVTMPISHQVTAPIEIPEYLRTGAWWQSRGALAALAVVLLVAATLYMASGLMGWFGGTPAVSALTVENAEGAGAKPQAEAVGNDVGSAEQPSAGGLGPPPQPLTPGIASPAAGSSAPPDRYEVVDGTKAAPAATGDEGATSNATPSNAAPDAGQIAAIPPATVEPPVTAPAETGAVVDGAAGSAAGETPQEQATTEPEVGPDAVVTEEVPAGPLELGTYLGGKTVLLHYDDQAGAWYRIEPRSAVVAGERLLALPEFRPKITLTSGVHLDLSGGTLVLMATGDETQGAGLPASGADVPAVEVVYGRIILINISNGESWVRLTLGPTVADVRLARNATLGVEVERRYVPGNDPRQTPAPVVARLFAPDGGVKWQDAAGEKSVDAPSTWTIENGATSEVAAAEGPPEWIDQEPIVQLSEQRFGAPLVESTLVSDRPVGTQLLELFQGSSRKEVKSLVARSSIYVGLFEPFIDALRDSEQRATWKAHIEALRGAMGLSPESAVQVFQALVEQRGAEAAADLYEMLCGYNADQVGRTPEQWKAGVLARLIDWLEEDSLDYRVLAVHDLAEITGKRLMSNPAGSSAERAQNVRSWRRRLQSGELRPLEE
ncbi:MAG: hypothetical protein WD738_17690 [Pirellulales bacterium]